MPATILQPGYAGNREASATFMRAAPVQIKKLTRIPKHFSLQ